MAFNSINRQFRTSADFAAWLAKQPRPDWPGDNNPRGSTFHNTYRPLPSQWLGLKSMQSMQKGYIEKGWSSGPHLYLVIGAPDPNNDGIWVMTPPTSPGTHAGDCNSGRFGIEVCGDFQNTAPSLPLQQLLIDVLVVFHRWAGLGPNLNAHRDCMPGRTCPGNAFYNLKTNLVGRLAARLSGAGFYRLLAPAAIFEAPTPRGPIALAGQAIAQAGEVIEIDEVRNDGWGHCANGVGFLPVGVLGKMPG